MASNFLENLSIAEANLNSRILDLVLGRVFKRAYLTLDEKGREIIEKVFLSGDADGKEEIIKKYIPNFKTFFAEEAKKIENEIKVGIERQF